MNRNRNHYEAVLADLRTQRQKIDTAISVLEDLLGVGNAPAGTAPAIAQIAIFDNADGAGEPPDFTGARLQDAIIQVVERASTPPVTKDVFDRVVEGGRQTTYNSVYNTLDRLAKLGRVTRLEGGRWDVPSRSAH